MSLSLSPFYEKSKLLTSGQQIELWQLGSQGLKDVSDFFYRRQCEAFRRFLNPMAYAEGLNRFHQENIPEKMFLEMGNLPQDTFCLAHKNKECGQLLSSFMIYPMPIGQPFKLNEKLWEESPITQVLRKSARVWYGSRFSLDVPALKRMGFSTLMTQALVKELLVQAFSYFLKHSGDFLCAELNVLSFRLFQERFEIPFEQVSDPFPIRWIEKEAVGIVLPADKMKAWLEKQEVGLQA